MENSLVDGCQFKCRDLEKKRPNAALTIAASLTTTGFRDVSRDTALRVQAISWNDTTP